MMHGFVEITQAPMDMKSCHEYIQKLRELNGKEPLGANLTHKYSTESKVTVICYFASEEGYEYAFTIASNIGKSHKTRRSVNETASIRRSKYNSNKGSAITKSNRNSNCQQISL